MKHAVLALLLIAGAETAALACSCVMPPREAAERQRLVREVARDAVALVEVELAEPYDGRTGRGERLRVRRTLAGRAPASVEIERGRAPSGAACDLVFRPGNRVLVLLYPPRRPVRSPGPRYRVSSSCTTHLLADAAFRAALIGEMGRHL